MTTSWKYRWAQIKDAFGVPVDLDVLAAYQDKIPRSINVKISRDGKYLTAVIKAIDGRDLGSGFATSGKNDAELITMINDAVQTYLDIPPEVCARMPLLLPEGYVSHKKLSGRKLEFVRA